MKLIKFSWPLALLLLAVGVGCGDDDDGNEADRLGIASICTDNMDCPRVEVRDGGTVQLICLTGFKGGYCGMQGCSTTADCPQGSICVRHTDMQTYCFRECANKPECNRNRPPDLEANCSSSFDFNDPADDLGQKACIPPSSGI
jgi:hypothetical protein